MLPFETSSLLRSRVAFASIVSLFALAGCASSHAHPAEAEPAPVVVTASPAHVVASDGGYRVSGTIRGHATATLTSKTVGYVRSIGVKSGDLVTAGDVLAVLESSDLDAASARAKAGLSIATSSQGEATHGLAAAEAAASNAKLTRDRIAVLVANGAASQQMLDDVDSAYRQAESARAAAEARVRGAGSAIAEARAAAAGADAMLGYSKIRAPFSGRVIDRRVDPGSLASPGSPLLVVEEQGRLRVEAAVEASRASRVHLDDQAAIEIDGVSDPISGKVVEIIPSVDVASRSLIVKLDLSRDVAGLQPGTFARVTFRDGVRDRLLIPTSAISPLGALDRAFVIEGDRVRLRMVTLGEPTGSEIEVRSGLAAGERVVVKPTSELRDGNRVTVSP